MMRLRHFFRRIDENAADPACGPVLIVALGDSVTQGCMAAGTFDFKGVYHQRLKTMLEARFPQTTFSVINAGVGGQKAANGLQRLERDVIRHRPDLLLLAFCLNDACEGVDGLSDYRDRIRAIIKQTRRKTDADMIVLTPNFMASEDNPRIAPQHRQYAATMIKTQNEGILKAYAEALKETAAAFQVTVADVYCRWEKLQRRGHCTTDFLSNGLNHPDEKRHLLAARTVMASIMAHQVE